MKPLLLFTLLTSLNLASLAAEKPNSPAEPDATPWRELQQKYLAASRAEHDARIKAWQEVAAWLEACGTAGADACGTPVAQARGLPYRKRPAWP